MTNPQLVHHKFIMNLMMMTLLVRPHGDFLPMDHLGPIFGLVGNTFCDKGILELVN